MRRGENKNSKNFTPLNLGRYSIGIIVSDFNSDITGKLLEGSLDFLERQGFNKNQIEIIHVPGSFEIPLMCQRMARTKKFDGLIALGAVIKGETDHYYYIASEASRGIMSVMLQESIPISFGVITALNLKQAKKRSGAKNNKGIEASMALLDMIANLNN